LVENIGQKLRLPHYVDERIKNLFRKVLSTEWAGRKTVISLLLICVYQVCNQSGYPVKFRYLLVSYTHFSRSTPIFRKTHTYYHEFLKLFNLPKV